MLVANEASAQLGGGFPGGGAGRRGGMRGGAGDADKSRRPPQAESRADTFQITLEELRIDLKLDNGQQAAWNSYAEKLAALLSDAARERSRSMPRVTAAASAPQQLDRMTMAAQNRATAIEEVATAAKALYALLSPEQKSVADARLANVTSLVLASSSGASQARAPGTKSP
jgi:hypothetical protein